MQDLRIGVLALAAACQPSTLSTVMDAPVDMLDGHVMHDAAHPDGPPPDTRFPDDAAPDAQAAACNTLANTGPMVTDVEVPQNPPAPTGGTIVDGTYVLTSDVHYTGPGGASGSGNAPRAITWQFDSGTIQNVGNIGVSPPEYRTFAFMTTGTSLTIATICGDGLGSYEVLGYDATPTQVVVHAQTQPSLTILSTFTRQ